MKYYCFHKDNKITAISPSDDLADDNKVEISEELFTDFMLAKEHIHEWFVNEKGEVEKISLSLIEPNPVKYIQFKPYTGLENGLICTYFKKSHTLEFSVSPMYSASIYEYASAEMTINLEDTKGKVVDKFEFFVGDLMASSKRFTIPKGTKVVLSTEQLFKNYYYKELNEDWLEHHMQFAQVGLIDAVTDTDMTDGVIVTIKDNSVYVDYKNVEPFAITLYLVSKDDPSELLGNLEAEETGEIIYPMDGLTVVSNSQHLRLEIVDERK